MNIIQPINKVRLRVGAIDKYPDNVYSFGVGEAYLMKRRGWAFVKKGQKHIYLRMPPGEQLSNPFEIEALISTEAEVMAMAEGVHREGKDFQTVVGEWPLAYVAEHVNRKFNVDPFTGEREEVEGVPIDARFTIGILSVWHVMIRWIDGAPKVSWSQRSGRNDTFKSLFSDLDHVPEEAIGSGIWEGAVERVVVNKYERNPEGRRKCLEHWGTICVACDTDLGKVYGPVAEGIIHCHHLVRLADIGQEYEMNPIKDMRPVCPNCHCIIHLRTPPYTIEEVREFLKRSQ